MSANSIMVIAPYLSDGMWVFDDPATGLVREPFVAGVPEILEYLLAVQGVSEPENGFNLIFSAAPFPGHQLHAEWVEEEMGGNWYKVGVAGVEAEGWLCPALYKYFTAAPPNLYVRVEAKRVTPPAGSVPAGSEPAGSVPIAATVPAPTPAAG